MKLCSASFPAKLRYLALSEDQICTLQFQYIVFGQLAVILFSCKSFHQNLIIFNFLPFRNCPIWKNDGNGYSPPNFSRKFTKIGAKTVVLHLKTFLTRNQLFLFRKRKFHTRNCQFRLKMSTYG